MQIRKILLLFLYLLFWLTNTAQTVSNLRSINIYKTNDTSLSDSLTIIPETIKIISSKGIIIDTSFYKYNIETKKVQLSNNFPSEYFPLRLDYKVFPFDLTQKYYNKKRAIKTMGVDSKLTFEDYYFREETASDNIFEFNDFQKSGTISRAVSVGNSQNLSILSNMNLQISGNISPELELIASISDDNIPIQPDGNTQQIQDFDKVFIQLKHEKGQITAGDFDMLTPNSYFLKYHKKAQGANANINFNINKNIKFSSYGSIALSRGKYNRNIIAGIEGNQGPYKLIGANFERNIVVLSGTEKVFIDGKLLTRGQNYDYIIDYNTSEITFMPNNLITKDKRISVEFQYSDRDYARYLSNAGFDFSSKNWEVATHYYVESDLKNQPLDQSLSSAQKELLYNIGDSLQLAVSSSVDSVAFNGNEVLYKKVDSLGYSPVYVYSISSDSAFYRLAFSFLGAGKGNYVQEKSSANGRVFKWISPISGIKQGDYEPVVILSTPKKKQMLTSLAKVKLAKKTFMNAEFAISDEDLNTFSPYNKNDNVAPAIKLNLNNEVNLSKKETPWILNTSLDYQFVERNFRAVERFRDVEFYRNWNAQDILNTNQQLAGVKFLLTKNNIGNFGYEIQNFIAESKYKGFNNTMYANLNLNKFKINGQTSLISTDEVFRNSRYFKHNFSLERPTKFFSFGVSENFEKNILKHQGNDTLFLNSFSFQEIETYVKTVDTLNTSVKIHYKYRKDYLPTQFSLIKSMTANEFGFNFTALKSNINKVNIMANYRKLLVSDSTLTSQNPENTALGQIEYSLKLKKIGLKAQSFYQLGSGVEASMDYSYIEVAPGQGVYSWNDYNSNKVKELNEFEMAAFKDQANYIRINLPSNNFIKTYTNQFSTSIDINPASVFGNSKSNLVSVLSKISNNLMYNSSLKTLNNNILEYMNPFINNDNNERISFNSSFRNTVYFNRLNPKYGFDYSFISNKNKILMTNGYESRSRKEHQIKFHWNINRAFLIQMEEDLGNKQSMSEYFESRDFDIVSSKSLINLTYQPNRVFRLSFPVSYDKKNNSKIYGNQAAELIKIQIAAKYNILSKGSLTAAIEQVNIKYSSQTVNNTVSFEMLEGLLPGLNYNWNIGYQRNISNNLQLSVIYNGRKNEISKIIHIGSVQLRAFF